MEYEELFEKIEELEARIQELESILYCRGLMSPAGSKSAYDLSEVAKLRRKNNDR